MIARHDGCDIRRQGCHPDRVVIGFTARRSGQRLRRHHLGMGRDRRDHLSTSAALNLACETSMSPRLSRDRRRNHDPGSDPALFGEVLNLRFGAPSGCPLHFQNCRNAALPHHDTIQATISVSGRGLIALPLAMRKAAGIQPQDTLIAEATPEGILLRPAVTFPVEIHSPERVAEFDAAEAELADALSRGRRE